MNAMKTMPYEVRGEIRLRAAMKTLERHLEKYLRDLETPTERMVICSHDLCVWMFRKFRVSLRRYVKTGAARGITILQLGWVVLSFRY
jgi:hypothetical protein